jgi:hypothetical protein
LASGKIIDAFTYAQPNGNKEWRNSINYVEDAVTHYSNWIGEYPYPVAQAVEGPGTNQAEEWNTDDYTYHQSGCR